MPQIDNGLSRVNEDASEWENIPERSIFSYKQIR